MKSFVVLITYIRNDEEDSEMYFYVHDSHLNEEMHSKMSKSECRKINFENHKKLSALSKAIEKKLDLNPDDHNHFQFIDTYASFFEFPLKPGLYNYNGVKKNDIFNLDSFIKQVEEERANPFLEDIEINC